MDQGECLDMVERVIVSPAVGVYHPLSPPTSGELEVGAVIGHITVPGTEPLPVRSPFRGQLVEEVAWSGERVGHRQRIAWVRLAA